MPFVHHDASTKRVFGVDHLISDMSSGELEDLFPEIPRLSTVIEKYSQDMHLMIEVKEPTSPEQEDILKGLLSHLDPKDDYHILSLNLSFYKNLNFVPNEARLPVSELNVREFSDAAIENDWGGLTGHFVLLNKDYKERHETADQKIGTGQISSRNAFLQRNK